MSTSPSILACVMRTLVQAAVFWSIFLGVIPAAIAKIEQKHLDLWPSTTAWWLGLAVLCLASAGGLSTAILMAVAGRGTPLPFDPTHRLVITGPYAYVCNPMAIFGLAQGLGVGVMLGSTFVLLYVLAGMLIWQFVVRRWEEADLLAKFGEPYASYRAHVRCWLPRLSRYTAAPSEPAA